MKCVKGILVGLGLGLGLCSQAWAQKPDKPVEVEVSRVLEKRVSSSVWVPGTIISREDARIAAELDGRLTLLVDVGERVKANQLIAAMNDRPLQLRLRRDRADLERLKVQLQFAEVQLKRTISLSKNKNASQSRIDELEQARDVLQHEVEIARIAVDESAYQLEQTKLYAPFSGVVVERFQQPGEFVTASEPLVRLVNIDALEITARAPMVISTFSGPGDTVLVKAKDKQFETTLKSIIPVGDTRTRMLEVRLNLGSGWVVGDAVSVNLLNGEPQTATVVPRDALIFRPNAVFVYVVDDQGQARKVSVTLGTGDLKNIAVSGALSAEDKVVIRGGERLEDGRTVAILNEDKGNS